MSLKLTIPIYWCDLIKRFSGKSFNALSLGLPSTLPLKYANIILSLSAESPVWYFINILYFHIKKLFNWFPKFVWCLVTLICVNSFFTHVTKKYLRNVRMEIYHFFTINEISRNTNIKAESNILSTSKNCQLHKNIVHRNDTTEHSNLVIIMQILHVGCNLTI